MPRELTERELCEDLRSIMRLLDQGESFIVTGAGTPVGELTPLRRRRFVRGAGGGGGGLPLYTGNGADFVALGGLVDVVVV